MRWVATPPPGAGGPPRRPRRLRYLGPPSYASPPRWGFPPLAWRWPTSVPGATAREPASVDRVRALARYAVTALVVLVAMLLVAAAGEIWRYVLLLASRTSALPRGVVAASDALVVTGAVLSIIAGVLAAVTVLWWLFVARRVAADLAGHEPARPDWQVLLYLVIPGINLAVAGAVLAEFEHAVLHRAAGERPRPTRLVLWWWGVWVGGGLLCGATLLWRFRAGVQAQADGVVLAAVTDLAAIAVAVVTVLVVRRFSTLLAPIDPASVRFMRVIRVDGAPEPELRATRPAGAAR